MTSPSPFATAATRWIAIIPVALLAVVLVGLNVVIDPSSYDVSQLPRLLVLSAFLLVLTPLVLLVPAVASRLDTSVLREPVVVASAVSLLISVASLTFATNMSAGWTDIFRTLAAVGVLGGGCLLLPLDRGWRQRVVEALVLAAVVAVALGASETLTRCGPGFPSRRAMEVVTGRMANVNLYAGLLAMLLPWCLGGTALLAGGWRWLSAATAVGTLALIVLVQSRATLHARSVCSVAASTLATRRSSGSGDSRFVIRLVDERATSLRIESDSSHASWLGSAQSGQSAIHVATTVSPPGRASPGWHQLTPPSAGPQGRHVARVQAIVRHPAAVSSGSSGSPTRLVAPSTPTVR